MNTFFTEYPNVFEDKILRNNMEKLDKRMLNFQKPEYSLYGEYLYNYTSKKDPIIHLYALYGEQCFDNKDYRNYLVFDKLSIYQAHLASLLLNISEEVEFFYETNKLVPTITVKCFYQDKKSFLLKIDALIPELYVNRVGLDAKNVKANFLNNIFGGEEEYEDDDKVQGTIIYNLELQRLQMSLQLNELLKPLFKNIPALSNGMFLLKKWNNTCNLPLSEHLFECTILAVNKKGIINKYSSPIEIMRIVLKFISDGSFSKGFSLGGRKIPEDMGTVERMKLLRENEKMDTSDIEQFKDLGFGCLLYQGKNLLYPITLNVLSEYERLMSSSLEFLMKHDELNGEFVFKELFLQSRPSYVRFDACISLKGLLERWHQCNGSLKEELKKFCLDAYFQMHVLTKFVQSLNTNVSLITDVYYEIFEDEIVFYFSFNEQEMHSTLLKGPPTQTNAGNKFRDFWGSVSEIRAFEDGNQLETVVFDENTTSISTLVTVVDYLLTRLFYDDGVSSLEDTSEDYELSVRTPDIFRRNLGSYDVAATSFARLSSILFKLKLPLQVKRVSAISDVLRGSCAYMIEPLQMPIEDVQMNVPTYGVVMEMVHSGSWPDDINAMNVILSGFYVQMQAQLRDQYSKLYGQTLFSVVKRNEIIIILNGIAFNIHIFVPRMAFLMKVQNEQNKENIELDNYMRTNVIIPRLHTFVESAIAKVPEIGVAIRWLKTWKDSHWLNICDEAMELLVLAIFQDNARALSRSCLSVYQIIIQTFKAISLVSVGHSFNNHFFLTNEFPDYSKDLKDVIKKVYENIEQYPHIYLHTDFDLDGEVFTKSIDKETILRFVDLATKHLELLKNVSQGKIIAGEKTATSMLAFDEEIARNTFDIIFYLRNPFDIQNSDSKFKNMDLTLVKEFTHENLLFNFNILEMACNNFASKFSDDCHICFNREFSSIGIIWKVPKFLPQKAIIPNLKDLIVCGDINNSKKKPVFGVRNTFALIHRMKVELEGLVKEFWLS
eukprot:TRINITY_DN2727_c0_g1_i1.p1 TRINITY_DN2727_c0_g1~~TRINITY_DN2727_c0_g1_i1.p1  ORF type:complete len:1059 (+),score=302.92 TRINITY_DN2727_c0_g1_i1:173-3178(+)